MNLLVGLTVNKIDKLDETGEKIQAIKRVEEIHLMAKILEKLRNLPGCLRWAPKNIMETLSKEGSKKVI